MPEKKPTLRTMSRKKNLKKMFFRKNSYSLRKLNSGRTSIREHYNTRDGDSNTANESGTKEIVPVTFRPFLGSFYMFLHAIFLQLTAVIVKMLTYMDPCQFAMIRSVCTFSVILPITIYHSEPILGDSKYRRYLLLCAIFNSTAFYFRIMAWNYLPIAEASIVMSINPATTAILARILLKEPYDMVQSLSLFMTIGGMLLVLKIPELLRDRNDVQYDSTYVAGISAAFANVILSGLTAVCTRKLKNCHFSITLMYLGVIGIVENAVLSVIFVSSIPPVCGWDQALCILFGVFIVIASYLYIAALQVEPAGLGIVQKCSFDILIILAFQIIFFNVYPNLYDISGGFLVIGSLSILGIRNWILIMPDTNRLKKLGNASCASRSF